MSKSVMTHSSFWGPAASVAGALLNPSQIPDLIRLGRRTAEATRPKAFYPRIDQITLYALEIERLTGKEIVLPDISGQWPALDRSKTPNARPPGS